MFFRRVLNQRLAYNQKDALWSGKVSSLHAFHLGEGQANKQCISFIHIIIAYVRFNDIQWVFCRGSRAKLVQSWVYKPQDAGSVELSCNTFPSHFPFSSISRCVVSLMHPFCLFCISCWSMWRCSSSVPEHLDVEVSRLSLDHFSTHGLPTFTQRQKRWKSSSYQRSKVPWSQHIAYTGTCTMESCFNMFQHPWHLWRFWHR